MRIAWLVWEDDDEDTRPIVYFSEPPMWVHRKKRIVYAEVEE